jgi:Protein of unknown function (DUF3106)
MKAGKHIAGYLAGAAVAAALALPCVSLAALHPPQQKEQAPPSPRAEISRPHDEWPAHGHAGDWLRRYKDMPPEEQERALQNNPAFRRLPPGQQQRLLKRLQHFSNLSPDEQLRMLNRMETWEHLTPAQKQQAWQIFSQMRNLPPDRRHLVHQAIRELRAMPPDQREHEIDSDQYRNRFTDHERDMIRGITRLPLAPPEGGPEGGPPGPQD